MPISVTWDNDGKTILMRKMTNPWTWQDYGDAMKVVHQMLSEVEHTVDIIVDCTEINDLPDGALGTLAKSNRQYPTNMGKQYIVSSSYFIEIFSSMLADMASSKKSLFIHKLTMQEAYADIQAEREKSQ